ncbi:hypothetical protein RRF57_012878 [Xylaria bambusicola]|uniref:Uncharacterized protein n=1 Tax=Xylaria bambusicola TaxID=326684 RepID=A0AAN7V131_9PEZI
MAGMGVALTSGNSLPQSRWPIPRIGREIRHRQFPSQHKRFHIRQDMKYQANKSPNRSERHLWRGPNSAVQASTAGRPGRPGR